MYNRPSMRTIAAGAILITILCVPLSAQWFGFPTPGLPRTADGKPNLAAPVPKAADGHPDLSGVWSPNSAPLQVIAPEASIPFQPWSLKLTHDRADGARGKDDPASYCVPGMPKLIVLPYPYKIVQVPGMMLMLYEGFTTYRQISPTAARFLKTRSPRGWDTRSANGMGTLSWWIRSASTIVPGWITRAARTATPCT